LYSRWCNRYVQTIQFHSLTQCIAITRDPTKAIQLKARDFTQHIYIYTSSGSLISKIRWDSVSQGNLLHIGWSDDECIICVTEDAHVYVYDVVGRLVFQFGFVSEVSETGILKIVTWGNGIAILTRDFRLWVVSDLDSTYCEQFARIPSSSSSSTTSSSIETIGINMTVIPEEYSTCGSLEILLSVPHSKTIYFVSKSRCLDGKVNYGPFPQMAASPSGETIATFSASGTLRVSKSDLNTIYAEFDTKSSVPPKQIAWVGEDSVCLYWEPEQLNRDTSLLLMFGPNGSLQKFSYDGPLFLCTEVDGLRIFSNSECEFLQRVPAPVYDIFKIGSDTASANLFDSFSEFDRSNRINMTSMSNISKQLPHAVTECLAAATHEMEASSQRKLLRAAEFGKAFCTELNTFENTKLFMNTCKTIRVLNAVSDFSIGIPLTVEQLDRLSPDKLIDRLLARLEHLLAYRLSQYLNLDVSRVLLHWACVKVKSTLSSQWSEQDLFEQIVDKLQNYPVPYSKIAATALRQGKRSLALKLLEREERPGEQVPLLLKMDEPKTALRMAVASGETDLIYLVLLEMKSKLEAHSFFQMINEKGFETARDLFISYCKQVDRDFLAIFFNALEQPQEAANLYVEDSFYTDNIPLQKKLLNQARELYSKKRDCYMDAKVAEQQRNLLELQNSLDQTMGQKLFYGQSVNDTIYNLLLLNNSLEAKVKSDYKVSDKTYWNLKIAAYVKTNRWTDLENLAKKKSPVGYKPFVEACIKRGNDTEAMKYIPKVTDPWERIDLFLELGKFKEAIESAYVSKNIDMLLFIRSKATAASTRGTIDDLIHKLGG
jgi:hypothetical protein